MQSMRFVVGIRPLAVAEYVNEFAAGGADSRRSVGSISNSFLRQIGFLFDLRLLQTVRVQPRRDGGSLPCQLAIRSTVLTTVQ